MFFYYDPTIILVFIGLGLSLWASSAFNGNMEKYGRVKSCIGITAAEAAERILESNGIYDVAVELSNRRSSDCYNTTTRVLYLSPENYNSTSIAAIGVAAHECGHAIQQATGYVPLSFKNAIAPVCSIASNLGIYVAIFGMLFASYTLVDVGILMFTLGVFVTLLLLPIEFDASNRALAILEDSGMLVGDEIRGARKVLRSAGMTYVAAAASSILTLLRLLIIFGGNRRR